MLDFFELLNALLISTDRSVVRLLNDWSKLQHIQKKLLTTCPQGHNYCTPLPGGNVIAFQGPGNQPELMTSCDLQSHDCTCWFLTKKTPTHSQEWICLTMMRFA